MADGILRLVAKGRTAKANPKSTQSGLDLEDRGLQGVQDGQGRLSDLFHLIENHSVNRSAEKVARH